MDATKNFKFINWAKNVSSITSNYFQPNTEEEIIDIVKNNPKIRMVGSGHSWSDICKTNDTLINLDHYNKVLNIDKTLRTITLQSGIKLRHLNKILDSNGLALLNLGSIDKQSISGAISTGTHGTGINFQILGSQILSFTLIKADGTKLFIHKEKDSALYEACVVNLGCLGIISTITLQVVDAYNLHDRTSTMSFDEVIDNLDTLLQKNDHLKLWWLAPSKNVIVYRYQRTQEKRNDTRIRQFLKDEFLSVLVYRSLVFLAKIFPRLAKGINKLLTMSYDGGLDRIEKSYKVFIVPEPPLHRETEWTFDLSKAKEILSAYKKMIVDKKFNLNFIQEIRFTNGDDFWLSASYQRPSLWLGLYAYNHEKWDEVMPTFEDFAKKYKGRPHWGKEFTMNSEYLKNAYPKFIDFKKLMLEVDPNRKFENEFIKHLFE